MTEEEQKAYDEEYAREAQKLEEAAQATTSRDDQGRFAKPAEPETAEQEPAKKTEAEAEPAKPAEPDPLAEIRKKLDATEKALLDTKAWGTRNAQELAALRRESEERKRAESRPTILDANPELEAAIKYVVPEVEKPRPDPRTQWLEIVNKAHPGIFDVNIDPDLEQALVKRLEANQEAREDPLVAIREITAEKLAHAERVVGKRFAAESAKAREKGAMNVPGAGGGGSQRAAVDTDLEAVNRIANMSPAEFEKERRKVMGY